MKPIFEKIYIEKEGFFKAFVNENNYFDAPWHYHPEFELTLILKGTGMRYVGNNISAFTNGDIVLLHSGLPHCWKNTNVDGAKAVVIQWNKALLKLSQEFKDISNLLELAKRGVHFNEDLSLIFEEIIQIESHFLKFTSFLNLLYKLAQSKKYHLLADATYQVDTSRKTTDRLDLIHQYLENHYREKISLDQMAALLNITKQSFSRFFSQRMQKPFFSYLNEYRIGRSCKYLIEMDLQVSEIAYRCGYESLPFYFKQFKKYTGFSPLHYRMKYKVEALS